MFNKNKNKKHVDLEKRYISSNQFFVRYIIIMVNNTYLISFLIENIKLNQFVSLKSNFLRVYHFFVVTALIFVELMLYLNKIEEYKYILYLLFYELNRLNRKMHLKCLRI